jgi:predicted unusual protein kinase regulating ubiquinone biosynthesis (AarF/ABC1/UbiB family)
MALSLKPRHLKRYSEIAWLLVKYGRGDLVKKAGLDRLVEPDEPRPSGEEEPPPEARNLADDLERLGPTFVKLGQLLSTRPDLVPDGYIQALSRLQDRVEPFSFEEVERIIAEELGAKISHLFSELDPVPIAAASLGQVHRAALRDGRPVAVKVQRPGIREAILEDLETMRELADFLDRHTDSGRRVGARGIVSEFRKSLLGELDYRREARNLERLGENLGGFERIVVPLPVPGYLTSRILTMDYIRGKKITALTPLRRMEIDGEALADELFRAYLQQVLVDGFFHADPHPGNVFLTEDGRIALLDLGMTGRIAPGLQEKLIKLLLAVSDGRAEDAAEVSLEIVEPRKGFDKRRFLRRVTEIVSLHQDARMEDIDTGRVLLDLTRVSGESNGRPPKGLAMLGKTLLNLDRVGHALASRFDPNAAIRRHAADILRGKMVRNLSPQNIFAGFLELKDFAGRLPGRVNRILDAIATNSVKVKVDALDETRLLEAMQKIANRITLGLVLAAMIVAAALLMRVETSFRLFGYPGLAILLFLGAFTGGVILVFNILFRDVKKDRR